MSTTETQLVTSKPINLEQLAEKHPHVAAAIAIAEIIGTTLTDIAKQTNATVKQIATETNATVKDTVKETAKEITKSVQSMFHFWLLMILGTLVIFGIFLHFGEPMKAAVEELTKTSPTGAIFLVLVIQAITPLPLFLMVLIYNKIRE